jgi:hypothetical protein
MLGWNISVYRKSDHKKLAEWQSRLYGLIWIDDLVKEGHATFLDGNGYPYHFTATASHLLPPILEGPPEANEHWTHAPSDILLENWAGKTVLDHDAMSQCAPEEELLIEAWDES